MQKTRSSLTKFTTSTICHLIAAAATTVLTTKLLTLGKSTQIFAPLQVLTVFILIVGTTLLQARKHPLPDSFGIANRVTLFRLSLTAVLASQIGIAATLRPSELWFFVSLAVIALLFDAVDGWLARRFHIQSTFGAIFDLEVDASFILVLAIIVFELGKVGPWVLLVGAMRYLFVVAGWKICKLRRPLPPSRRRQVICVVQAISLIIILCPITSAALATTIILFSLLLLLVSLYQDIYYLLSTERTMEACCGNTS